MPCHQIDDLENAVGMPSLKQLAIVAEVLGVQGHHRRLPRPPQLEYPRRLLGGLPRHLGRTDMNGRAGEPTDVGQQMGFGVVRHLVSFGQR